MPAGRPTIYTNKLGNEICQRIAKGESLRTIIADKKMPSASTICRWLIDDDKKEFWEQYAHARNVQAELMFDELLEIADKSDKIVKSGAAKKAGAFAQNQRLKVETRKWYLSKVLPKKFGEKLDLTSDGKAIKGNTIVFKDFDGTGSQ
jgi:terminase small subunit-like protein